MTGYILEKIYFEHQAGVNHPESPARLEAILEAIKKVKGLKKVKARAASPEEICFVHTKDYFDKIKITRENKFTSLDPDTGTNDKSFEAALYAAGGVLSLIDSVFKKEIDNGFAFVRPPGHHAEKDRARGFCLFNNIAIGASYALERYNLSRILILDLDLHHGNGTQQAFYKTDKVMYISAHQYPYFPGSGYFDEVGESKGKGYNINFPLNIGQGDNFYHHLLDRIIKPIVNQYAPELILVSFGFDTYGGDPLGGMKLTTKGYRNMTRQILEMADENCQGRLIYILEGGYNKEGIKEGTKAVLQSLKGKPVKEGISKQQKNKEFWQYYEEIKKYYEKYGFNIC
ncbi:MAG: histone deacetylase [Patescibacteria group bacterium]|nr:histone deacetylase [Patescibacteria group bacterium]